MSNRVVIIGILFLLSALAVVSLVLVAGQFRHGPAVAEPSGPPLPAPDPEPLATLVFVGDIMMARDVEKRLSAMSSGYGFSAVEHRLKADLVVGNFEASIPEVHEPTPSMVMRFSVPPALTSDLSAAGFTHMSLANNHAFDFGAAGFSNTGRELRSRGLAIAGSPNSIGPGSVFIEEVHGRRLVIVNVNATYGYPEAKTVRSAAPAGTDADLLVAYIHWGEEYELVHGPAQKRLAHGLIDAGFDLIVGHHPHVTQDVERYKDGLVFYSLGNFLFDQYWNDDVRQGLLLSVTIEDDEWKVDLVPVESKSVKVQPREMVGEARQSFLDGLAARSSASLRSAISQGLILIQRHP